MSGVRHSAAAHTDAAGARSCFVHVAISNWELDTCLDAS